MKRLLAACLTLLGMSLALAANPPKPPKPPKPQKHQKASKAAKSSKAAKAAKPSRASKPPWTAACDVAESQTVLWPAPAGAGRAGAGEVRAVWLDRHLIRWPGAGGEGRFRLHRSLRGQLLAAPGERVRGSDGALNLQRRAGEVVPAVADATVLALDVADAAGLPALLREQLLLVREDDEGRVLQATALRVAGALDDLYAAAGELSDLGVTVSPGRETNFRLWAPTAQRVSVCLHAGDGQPAQTRIPLQRDARTGAWGLRFGGDLSGGYYSYVLELAVRGGGVMSHRVTDPHAISLSADSRRASIASLDAPALKPPGWDTSPVPKRPDAATDRVIYQLHVRDFSISVMPVTPARRGSHGAFAETGPEGMKHLLAQARAGLTDVHLQPVPGFVGAAEDGPPGDADDDGPRRIVELRRMVMALNGAGLRVSMGDACDQGAGSGGGGGLRALDRVVPDYSEPLNAGSADRRTGCGDRAATEPLMLARLRADSQRRWARDFRVDTAGWPPGDPGARQIARQAYINAANEGPSALAPGKARADDLPRTADRVRAGLAGSLRGYVMTTWLDELLPLSKIDHAGQPAGDASEPGEVVNRAGNHDNPAFQRPLAASAAERADARYLEAAIVAFSQGIAVFDAGTASADLLKIRASSTLFRLRTAAEVQARLMFHNTGSVQLPTVLVGHLDGVGQPGAVFRDIVYLVNVDKVAQTVTVEPLKELPFELHPVHAALDAADRRASAATFDKASGSFTVPARTAVVFVVR